MVNEQNCRVANAVENGQEETRGGGLCGGREKVVNKIRIESCKLSSDRMLVLKLLATNFIKIVRMLAVYYVHHHQQQCHQYLLLTISNGSAGSTVNMWIIMH